MLVSIWQNVKNPSWVLQAMLDTDSIVVDYLE